MKEHFCPVEQSMIAYEGECNWCGEREGGMTQDELIKRLETACFGLDPIDPLRLLVDDVIAALAQTERDYERGFIDGMQKQMQSSVDKAVNAMPQRTWVGLTDEEILADGVLGYHFGKNGGAGPVTAKGKAIIEVVTTMLKERNA